MSTRCNFIPPTEAKPPLIVATAVEHGDDKTPWLLILISATTLWLAMGLYFASSQGSPWFLGVLMFPWAFGAIVLASVWIFVLGDTARLAIQHEWPSAGRVALRLIPFPIALALFVAGHDLALRTRFDLSEGAFSAIADRYEATGTKDEGRAGLYVVEDVYELNNCTVVITGGFFLDSYGFARCSGQPLNMPFWINMEHLTGSWWTFHHQD